jgi:hypothetical protein
LKLVAKGDELIDRLKVKVLQVAGSYFNSRHKLRQMKPKALNAIVAAQNGTTVEALS